MSIFWCPFQPGKTGRLLTVFSEALWPFHCGFTLSGAFQALPLIIAKMLAFLKLGESCSVESIELLPPGECRCVSTQGCFGRF